MRVGLALISKVFIEVEIVFFLLGSNLGNRFNLLESATLAISHRVGKVILKSSLYESDPVGFVSGNKFLNQVIKVESDIGKREILSIILDIEKQLGRKRLSGQSLLDYNGERVYTSRPIDIDILLYGNLIHHSPELDIPHPRMTERAFTMIPLAEIAADYIHPELNQSIGELAMKLDRKDCNRL